jgi:hypothetical protein
MKLGVWTLNWTITVAWNYSSSQPRSQQSLVRWATPQLHDIDSLDQMVDPALEGLYPAKSLSRFADAIALCVQVNCLSLVAISSLQPFAQCCWFINFKSGYPGSLSQNSGHQCQRLSSLWPVLCNDQAWGSVARGILAGSMNLVTTHSRSNWCVFPTEFDEGP